jgi:hypothetical protein
MGLLGTGIGRGGPLEESGRARLEGELMSAQAVLDSTMRELCEVSLRAFTAADFCSQLVGRLREGEIDG